jgi:RNase P subunit RPR2
MTGKPDSTSALMLEALIERAFGDKVTRVSGVLRTYYSGFDLSELARELAGKINEALNIPAQSVNSRDEIKGSYLNGRADAIEECARVCDKHATWSEEKIDDGDPASARNQMFATISNTANDCAEMIRDLKNSAPATSSSQNNAGMMPPETAHGVGAETSVSPQDSERRTCATCHAVLADGPQPAATYHSQEENRRCAECTCANGEPECKWIGPPSQEEKA